MKMKKYIALTAAFCLICSAVSCGEKKDAPAESRPTEIRPSESSTAASETEAPTAEEPPHFDLDTDDLQMINHIADNEYSLYDRFVFDIGDRFKLYDEEEGMFIVPEDPELMFMVFVGGVDNACSPEASNAYFTEFADRDKENVAAEVIHFENYDAGLVTYDSNNEERDIENYRMNSYTICVNGDPICFSAAMPAEREADSREIMKSVLDSVRYIGSKTLPDSPQTISNDYASVEVAPKWMRSTKRASDSDNISLRYSYSDNLTQLMSSLSISLADSEKYSDAKDMCEKKHASVMEKNGDTAGIIEEGEYTLGDNKGYCIVWEEYEEFMGQTAYRALYAFDIDGKIVSVGYNVYEYEGWEDARHDYEELMNEITFK